MFGTAYENIRFDGRYLILNSGVVYSFKSGRKLTCFLDKDNYLRVKLVNKKSRNFIVSRLVADHFIVNIQNLPEVNHINGIKSDNQVDNLEWQTSKGNMEHASLLGLVPRGEQNWQAN